VKHLSNNPHLATSNDRLTRVVKSSKPSLCGSQIVSPASEMVGLGDDVAVLVSGIGWKLGRIQKMVKWFDGKSKTSYILPVSLTQKQSGLKLYLGWYQKAAGGSRVFFYTLHDINPVPIDMVVKKVKMTQRERTKKWELGAEDHTYLQSGEWRDVQ
jgi:hypothetical protein